MKILVDTNIWVYSLDDDEPEKSRSAAAAISTAPGEIVVSTQVLIETYHALTRRLATPMSAAKAADVVEGVAGYPVLVTDSHLVRRAFRTCRQHQLSIWDALVVEAAVEAGCDEIWTEDLATGSTIRGVRIVNPLLADTGGGTDAE